MLKKYAFPRQGVANKGRSRGFNHDAQGQQGGMGQILRRKLLMQFLHDAAHLLHFIQAGNHGQHDGYVAHGPGAHERPQLCAKNALMPQAKAYAAQTQCRV